MQLLFIFGAIIIGIVILSTFMNYFFQLKERKVFHSKNLVPPIWANDETIQLFDQFNNAWSYKIEATINERIEKSNRNLKQAEIRESWYELKKYLLLASLSKGLPMFSKEVDKVWHFFLEDKALYKDFCNAFIGEEIEHHPHTSPKHLPRERAWFDILYLSFFSVSSHSHLWGKFLKEKAEYEYWIEQLQVNPARIKEIHRKQRNSAPTIEALDNFLKFAEEQLLKTNQTSKIKAQQIDGYWYGSAIFGFAAYGTIDYYEDQKKRKDAYGGDSGVTGSANSDDREKEWNEMTDDVNSFEVASDSGSSGSDSGSSCSSCSSCSGCSS